MKKLFLSSKQNQIAGKTPSLSRVSAVIGTLLILTGILVPSTTLIELIRSTKATHVEFLEQLILGATLFRVGLVTLGLIVIILGRAPIWKLNTDGKKPSLDSRYKSDLAILAIILIIAFALRLYKLDSGLWYDEILTYVKYVSVPFGETISTYEDQNQHFLYTLLAHAAFSIFGANAWALRFPAVLFGIGAIWALYLFGRQVTGSAEALLSATLLTFSYHHIWFSQNARGYSGLLFWTILTSWLLLRALNEERPQLWLFYAISVALGFYTNLIMLFVAIGQFIVYLMTLWARRKMDWPRRWWGFLLGFGLACFFTFLLHALVLPQVFGGLIGEESTIPDWTNPLWTLVEFFKAFQVGFAGGFVAVIALTIFGIGFVIYARTNPVVIQLLVIPTLLCAVVVIGLGHHLWPRFFIFTMGFGALIVIGSLMLLGKSIARFLNLSPLLGAKIGIALSFGLIFVSALSIPPVYGPKQDFQGAFDFVEAEKEQSDAVVTVGLATFTFRNFYKTDWEAVKTLEELNTIRAQAKRTWLIYTFPPEIQAVYPEIMTSIRRDFKAQKEFYGTVGSGTIFVYRSDIPPVYASATRARFFLNTQ